MNHYLGQSETIGLLTSLGSIVLITTLYLRGIWPFGGVPKSNRNMSLDTYNRKVQRSRHAISVTDIEGRFVIVNPLKVSYLGLQQEADVLGRFPWDFAPPEQPSEEASFIEGMKQINFAQAGRQPQFDWVLNTQSGEKFTIRVSLQPIELSGATYVRAIAVPAKSEV